MTIEYKKSVSLAAYNVIYSFQSVRTACNIFDVKISDVCEEIYRLRKEEDKRNGEVGPVDMSDVI